MLLKKDVCVFREQYPSARQQNIINYFSSLWGKPFSWFYSGDILGGGDETCESLKWLKGEKLEDLEDALVSWIGQVHTKKLNSNL
jgi:hypothetical protein